MSVIRSFIANNNNNQWQFRLWVMIDWGALKVSTYKRWIKSWAIYADAWVGILVGWRVGRSVDTSTRQAGVARQSQSRRVILAWANRLSWYRIVHDRSSVFAAGRRGVARSSGTVRCVRGAGILGCLREGTGREGPGLSATIGTQWRRWICLR